jgi:hypothetical protein
LNLEHRQQGGAIGELWLDGLDVVDRPHRPASRPGPVRRQIVGESAATPTVVFMAARKRAYLANENWCILDSGLVTR